MIERVYRFGPNECLLGIVTEPVCSQSHEGRPGVLLLNAGLLHRAGPHRLHVDLGRKLARQGFTVLRFDISGIGDSEMRGDKVPYEKRAIADIRDAMDVLEGKYRSRDFVLIGLCSGAHHAYLTAVEEKRVSGAVFLDGYAYRTLRYWIKALLSRSSDLFRIRKWKNLLGRIVSRRADGKRDDNFGFRFPTKKDFLSGLTTLLGRGVRLLFVFSGDVQRYYNYSEQFYDMVKDPNLKQGVCVEYLKEADHTYTLLEDRERLMSLICGWIAGHYG